MGVGRHSKPINLLKIEGKSKLTKAEILEREEASVEIGESIFRMPNDLRSLKRAREKWHFVLGLYREANLALVSSADTEILKQYCLIYEEFWKQNKLKDEAYNNGKPSDPDQYLKYFNAQMKTKELMLKYENLLYLTPVSRARTGGKPAKKPEKSELEQKGFAV